MGNLGRAMKWVALKQKGSTIVSMVVLPEDDGGLAMKFRAMCDQGLLGIGRGLRNPTDGELVALYCAQVGQAETKSWTS